MKEKKKKLIDKITMTLLIVIVLMLIIWDNIKDNVVVNITESVPIGIYYLVDIDTNKLKKGDIIAYKPKEEYKKFVKDGDKITLSIKPIAGLKGDRVEIKNDNIYVNNELYGSVEQKKDLPVYSGGIINEDEVLTLSKVEHSFDGRYYGTIKKKEILKKAILLMRCEN